MIIQAFASYLQSINEDIPSVVLLSKWIQNILEKKPSNNIERVIHHEINYSKNKIGMFIMTGKEKSGKILLESLYNFALSYEGQKFARWVHDKNASDFNVEKL